MKEKLTMLVVDDVAVNRASLSAMFRTEYDVEEAVDGLEAIKILQSQKVDIMILDLFMPNLDGSGVLKQMREEETLREIPVIVKTAVDENMEAEILRMGADDFIFSPIDPDVVKNRVNNLAQKYVLERTMMKRKIEEEKRIGRVRKTMLEQISEEIRNPINNILFMAEEGKTFALDVSKTRDAFVKIKKSGEHLLSLANDIATISKDGQEKRQMQESPFHLDGVVSAISNEMYAKCKEKGIEFSFEITNVLHEELLGDEKRLMQVWMALLENAYKYTEPGGYLRTSLFERKIEKQEVELLITVQDNGTMRNFSVVRSMVDLLEGTITVTSSNEKGTTFTLRLPYKYVKEQQKKDKKFNLMKVLIFDEDEIACNYNAINLSRLGMRCDVAETSEMALEMLQEAYEDGQKYDIFLVNWYMRDGQKMIQKVRGWFDRDTLLIVSASGEIQVAAEEMKRAGVDYILEKPVLQSGIYQLMTEICKFRN